jgi:hypothetical protein
VKNRRKKELKEWKAEKKRMKERKKEKEG